MKTNKSYTDRFKVTKNNKLIGRRIGTNHYKAREQRRRQLARAMPKGYVFSNKDRGRFMPRVGRGKTDQE